MLAAFGAALVLISAIANVAAGLYVLVSWLRSEPIDPKEEERARVRSLSWPTENGAAFPESRAEPTAVE